MSRPMWRMLTDHQPVDRTRGWTCRACDRGDHRWCEFETNGVPCVCTDGECGDSNYPHDEGSG